MHMNQIFDVFISYRPSDGTELAKVVCDYLTSRGLRVFLNTNDLTDGKIFYTQIRRTLLTTPHFVLIATPDVFRFRREDDWVRYEMTIAVNEFKKNPRDRSVIPLVPAITAFPGYGLPKGLEDLPRFSRINLKSVAPSEAELHCLARAVCRVNRRRMERAGHRFLKECSVEGSRFFPPCADERIMPLNRNEKKPKASGSLLPVCVTFGPHREEISINDAVQARNYSFCLIGGKGTGKTTALLGIMESTYKGNYYSEHTELPIFVDLTGAPRRGGCYSGEEGLPSGFILREIARLFLGLDSAAKVPKDYVSNINALFGRRNRFPEYLLLLDGLDETSTESVSDDNDNDNGNSRSIRSLLTDEIIYLLTRCPNVRVMFTGNTEKTDINWSEYGVKKLCFTGLKPESAAGYLGGKKYSSREINDVMSRSGLADCIAKPLFLSLFGSLKNTEGVSNRSEIISRFLNERREKLQTEYIRESPMDSGTKEWVTKWQLWFMLDFLLPAIGSHMERTGSVKISPDEAAGVIEPILSGREEQGNGPDNSVCQCSVLGEYGRKCFPDYKGSEGLPAIARSILEVNGEMAEVAEFVLKASTDVLGLLYRDAGNAFGFIHCCFRDYFASFYDVNRLRIAIQAASKCNYDLALTSLASFTGRVNDREKTEWMVEQFGVNDKAGNFLGKKRKKNAPDPEKAPIQMEHALTVFRGRFDDEVGYGVYNLIEMIKLTGKELSEVDLSYLDLSLVSFNGLRLGRAGAEGACLQGAKISMDNLVCQGHSDTVESVACSPDGRRIISGSHDGTVKEWDRLTGQCVRTYAGHSDWVNSVAFFPDGRTFLSGSRDNTVREWDRVTGRRIRTYAGHSRAVTAVACSPDGRTFLSASVDKTVRQWDTQTGQCVFTFAGHTGSVYSVAYSPDGMTFLSGAVDGTVMEWDLLSGECIRTYSGHTDWVNTVACSPDVRTFLSGSNDNTVREWDRSTGQCICVYNGHGSFVNSVAYSPNGRSFVSESYKSVLEWDIAAGQCIRRYNGHSHFVNSVAYAPDGRTLLSGGMDGTVMEWDRFSGRCIRKFDRYNGAVCSAAFSPDGATFLTGTVEHTVREWDTATGRCVRTYEGHGGQVNSVAYAPDGCTVISGSADNTVREWDVATCRCIRTYEGCGGEVKSVAFSPEGNTILSAGGDNAVMEWDRAAGQCVCTYDSFGNDICPAAFSPAGRRSFSKSRFTRNREANRAAEQPPHRMRERGGEVREAAYSPDGRIVLSADRNSVKLWNRFTERCICVCQGHSGEVNCADCFTDGKSVLSGSSDKSVREWDIASGQCIRVFQGHNGAVLSVACSPDGKTFLSGSADKTVREWDRITGECLHTYEGHKGSVNTVVYAPDGRTILSGAEDGTLCLWSTETGECLRVTRNYPGLHITGCDMRDLHEESTVDREALRQYGAVVE